MRVSFHVLMRWVVVATGFAGALSAAEPTPPRKPPEFRQLPPLPGVVAAAKAENIALEGLAALADRAAMIPGDQVTVLASLTEGATLQQWVINVVAVQPTPKEAAAPARQARLYSGTGREFVFGSARAALAVTVVGPFKSTDPKAKPETKRKRIAVGMDYLSLGLERTPALVLRLRSLKETRPDLKGTTGSLSVSTQPPAAAAATEARKVAALVGIEEADERAMAGGVLALLEFFDVTAKTPGLQDVLLSVIDVPWWSFIKSGGQLKGLNFQGLSYDRALEAAAWKLPADTKVYASSTLLHINGQPTLAFQMAVTAPKPPLTVSAGVVGIAAGRPDGKGPVLTMQVVASRAAAGSEGK